MSTISDKLIKGTKEASIIIGLSFILAFSINAIRSDGLQIMPIHIKQNETDEHSNSIRVYTTDECLSLLKSGKALFIDAREVDTFKMGHLPGALNVPKELIDQNLACLKDAQQKKKILITYCDGQGCAKAEELTKALQYKGITSIGLFADGWEGWMEKGYPIDE